MPGGADHNARGCPSGCPPQGGEGGGLPRQSSFAHLKVRTPPPGPLWTPSGPQPSEVVDGHGV
eukprot:231936-Prorocentrum_minimum.AAC.1